MKVGDLVQYAQDVEWRSVNGWGYGMVTAAYMEERTVEVFWPSKGMSRTTHPEFLEVVSDS